jgi:WD40 repeat protein
MSPDDLLRLVLVGDPQINLIGDRVLFSHKTITDKNKYLSRLCTVDLEGHLRHWTGSEASASYGRWSPDGNWISFISSRKDDIFQIFLLSTQGGEAEKLTSFPEGSIGSMLWSPDGTKIALTFRLTAVEATQAAAKERAESGMSSPPMVFDDLKYRLDGDGYFGNQRYELVVIDVKKALASEGDLETCTVCKYSEAVHGEYDFDWSPDSQELAVIHSTSKHPFIDPPDDQIWRDFPKELNRHPDGRRMASGSPMRAMWMRTTHGGSEIRRSTWPRLRAGNRRISRARRISIAEWPP